MRLHTTTAHNRLHCGDVMDWGHAVEPGSVKLLHVDGPYDMRKAEWDILTGAAQGFAERLPEAVQRGDLTDGQAARLSAYVALVASYDRKGADLIAWYVPVLASLSQACALSASAYLWNTDGGEALLRPVMQVLGWTWRGTVTWDKGVASMAGKVDTEGLRTWYDVTEACGFYQREEWAPSTCAGSEIAAAANADPRNTAARFLAEERASAGMTRRDLAAFFPSRTGGLTGCVSNWEGGQNFPTADIWQACSEAMQQTCPRPQGARPYRVLPEHWPGDSDALRASYNHLREEYDHLREEYEASRPPFTAPLGVSNVWSHPTVPGRLRLKHAETGETHPCEKPLAFAERTLRASSRPGDLVLDAFAGTCRLAVANARSLDRGERRQVVSIDMDSGWLDAVAATLSTSASLSTLGTEQAPSLFGGHHA